MALLLLLSSAEALAASRKVVLAGAADGGVVRTEDGVEIRLSGIFPASGDAARSRLAELVSGDGWMFLPMGEKHDRYGRETGRITGPDGHSLAEKMVREGLAVFLPEQGLPQKDVRSLLAAESSARLSGLGMWGKGLRVYPADGSIPVGQFALIEGVVLETGRAGDEAFLNFGWDYRRDFTVVLPRRLWKSLGDHAAFAGHRVRVRGYVMWRSGPQVEISRKEAVELLD